MCGEIDVPCQVNTCFQRIW